MKKDQNSTLITEAQHILSQVNNLLGIEIANASKNVNQVMTCGLPLTRLCHVTSILSFDLNSDKMTTRKSNFAKEALYSLIMAEIKDETNNAKDGNYDKRLLANIYKGIGFVKNQFFVRAKK